MNDAPAALDLAALAGERVAVWGFGREGRAVLAAIRARLPMQPLTLFCQPVEAAEAIRLDPALEVIDIEPEAATLAGFDVVVKSPGISAYRPALLAAQARGTRFTSGTALWFAEHAHAGRDAAPVIAVTGTKGKSTTTALLAHLARSLGVRTALAGNIGLPLLELLDQDAELWVIELSSFQTGEAGPLAVGVITGLHEEHLDWHGTRERYQQDKLKLAKVASVLVVNGAQATLAGLTAGHPGRVLYGVPSGWHVAGAAIRYGGDVVFPLDALPLPGLHNARNACAALAALEAAGLDARAAAHALRDFRPLPHRLQRLGQREGIDWIDDSISTTPDAALAALQSLAGRERGIVLLLGGHDRGLDWNGFAAEVATSPPRALVCSGASGARVAAALRAGNVPASIVQADDLGAAVTQARRLAPTGGCVLLSPGAPSFDQFRDYAERGRRFAELAGFDPAAIGGIAGLGIA